MLLEGKIPLYYIFNKIKKDIFIIALVGTTVQFLKSKFRYLIPEMPSYIPALLGTSISILLSFKVNQSYDRWWEARKIWGAIVNDSRTWVVQLQTLLSGRSDLVRAMAYRQIAFCYSLGQSLRGLNPLENAEQFLTDEDKKHISAQSNKSLALVQLNAMDLRALRDESTISEYYHVQLDNTLVRLVDSMGRAERIKATVFPSTYRLFLHFVIYVFIITLSISLDNVDAIFELPLLVVIASCFFLIEKSAYRMQNPFNNLPSDTAVTAIARTIEINIRELLGEADTPQPLAPEAFYLM